MKKLMNLNKENASRLWVQQFGKRQKTIDFAGREIAKAAYNDRNSNYGWNVDHILPLSRGGKTADYNLICCHILTNDEKADKFPCFKANAKEFEIRKRQNHYEITAKTAYQKEEEDETINFLDVAQGLKCWKQCKSNNERVFVGYVKIRVEISNESDIVGGVPTKEDTENFLDDCIILNTYSNYFTSNTGFESIQIVCGMKDYDSHLKMSLNCKKDIVEKQVQFMGALAIDELVKINTSAIKKLKDSSSQNGFYPYNFIFTNLEKNLEKFI